jgi:hypothetical protein
MNKINRVLMVDGKPYMGQVKYEILEDVTAYISSCNSIRQPLFLAKGTILTEIQDSYSTGFCPSEIVVRYLIDGTGYSLVWSTFWGLTPMAKVFKFIGE